MPRHVPSRTVSFISVAAILVGSVIVFSVAQADTASRLREAFPSRAGGCDTARDGATSDVGLCLFGNGLNVLLDEGARLAREYGERTLGRHFRVVGNPQFSPDSDRIGLTGNLDVVIPFAGEFFPAVEEPAESALFLQQGITRWRDDSGSLRNDLRHGLAYRFRVSGNSDADILGFSVLRLHSAEHRHVVLMSGIDYTGRWGNGSFRYYSPTTHWRPERPGHEERALAGAELATRFDITSTLRMNTTGYRWGSGDETGHRSSGLRLELGWRPHPWLNLAAGYDRDGGGDEALSLHATLRMPLEDLSNPPRWRGLGVAAAGTTPADSQLWRPVEGGRRIRVVTRSSVSVPVGDAEIRFLQDTVGSGNAVQLEVVLSSAATQDLRVEVRLVPGSGTNPAVPGEDFVDRPVEITIPVGATTGQVSIQLLRNDGLSERRSLSATVSPVS